jgi:hypothetical protein
VVAVADLHGVLPAVPPCELLLVAGDLCPLEDHGEAHQRRWLHTVFRAWLERAPARRRVGIAGNHDLVAQRDAAVLADLPWDYLCDSGTEVLGRRIWGSPWQPPFFDWAFNLPEDELEGRWALIPEDTDVLLTHGPPRGVGDRVGRRSAGSVTLRARVERLAPELHVFGHIHEGRGLYRLGDSLLANAALVDEHYRPRHAPLELVLPADRPCVAPRGANS